VDNPIDHAVAVGHSVDATVWQRVLRDAFGRVGRWFVRSETRGTVVAFVAGLLGPVERKNGWWLAEYAGHGSPDRMQRLLCTAVWDEREVQVDLARFVVDQLGATDPALVIDETGFLKKGTCSVGVQRQCSGTAGRIENSQIGVSSATPARPGAPCWMFGSTCPGPGLRIRCGARRPACRRASSSRPSRSWPCR